MSRKVLPGIGAGRGSAPAILPEYVDSDLDDELVDLLCDDRAWLEETFREIVATSWAEPPRGGAARPAAHPRRYGVPSARGERRGTVPGSQWSAQPSGRQRSPPGAGADPPRRVGERA